MLFPPTVHNGRLVDIIIVKLVYNIEILVLLLQQ
jgi:hypothetical protein